MRIDTYSNLTGWSTGDNTLPDDNQNLAEALEAAGFECFEEIGDPDCCSGIRIYQNDGSYMVSMETSSSDRRFIGCPDLPSCLGVLAQLEPWLRMSQASAVERINRELYELLVEYGKDGPLAAPLADRAHKTELRAERRRQRRLKADGKANGIPPS